MYLLYIVFLSCSQKFSRSLVATLARLRFIHHLEMQACNVLYQPHLYFYNIFSVIISDCQLPKFTENTHKIAQNRVQNVQKLRGWGWRKGGGGRREKWEESAAMAVGGIDALAQLVHGVSR